MSIVEEIHNAVKKKPDATALVWIPSIQQSSIKKWTFTEVWTLANKCSNCLCELIPKQPLTQNIAIMVDEGPYLPILELAILIANCTIVPMDATDPRTIHLIEDAEPCIIIAKDTTSTQLSNTKYCTIISLDALLDMKPTTIDRQPPTEISHIFFTSGSTGRPKGCIVTHASLLSYCHAKNTVHQVDHTSTCFVGSPHTFDPSIGDFMATWIVGGTVAMAPKSCIIGALGACLVLSHATHVLTTPSLFDTLGTNAPERLKQLKVVALGGESMSQRIVDIWSRKVRLLNTYGVTECCVYQACAVIQPDDPGNLFGEALPGNVISIMPLDGDDEPMSGELGDRGEIWISGTQVGIGYLKNPVLTESRFVQHRTLGKCFRTGDIVEKIEKGWRIVGRSDTQVKIAGKRVELGEIENVLLKSATPTLLQSIVTSINDEKLIAWYIPTGSFNDSQNELLAELLRYLGEQTLPRHMIPSRFVPVSEYPTTGSGKIARSVLCEMPVPEITFQTEEELTNWEQLVSNVWIQVLGLRLTKLLPSSQFFALGGDSLSALRVCHQISKQIKQETAKDEFGELLGDLAPAELMKRPILCEFASYLSQISDKAVEKVETQQEANDALLNIFYRAASIGSPQIVQFLLENKGFDPDGKSNTKGNFMTPLHTACANGRVEVVALLLEKGASASTRDPNGVMPIHMAAQHGPTEILDLLVKKVPLHVRDDNEQTILHHAARADAPGKVFNWIIERWDKDKNVQLMSKKCGFYDWEDKWGRTPLHWATVNGHRNSVTRLLDLKVDRKKKDKSGETALEIAERRAKCGAAELRPNGMGASVFGDIAKVLGGSGTTKQVKTYDK